MIFLRTDYGSVGYLLIGIALYFLVDTYKKIKKRGFFCEDSRLRYPHVPKVIGTAALNMFCLTIPIVVIILMGTWHIWHYRMVQQRLIRGRVRAWILIGMRHVLSFGCGLVTEELLVSLSKKMVGSLRPNFIAICQPDICNESDLLNPHLYQINYTCTHDEAEDLMDATRLSFPSSGSATSTYASVFTVMYIEKRTHWHDEIIAPKTAIQWAFLAAAFWASLSRMRDYSHHWIDIVGGALMGFTFAWFWINYVLCVHPDPITKEDSEELERIIEERRKKRLEARKKKSMSKNKNKNRNKT